MYWLLLFSFHFRQFTLVIDITMPLHIIIAAAISYADDYAIASCHFIILRHIIAFRHIISHYHTLAMPLLPHVFQLIAAIAGHYVSHFSLIIIIDITHADIITILILHILHILRHYACH